LTFGFGAAGPEAATAAAGLAMNSSQAAQLPKIADTNCTTKTDHVKLLIVQVFAEI
jgi:hypothetical protein